MTSRAVLAWCLAASFALLAIGATAAATAAPATTPAGYAATGYDASAIKRVDPQAIGPVDTDPGLVYASRGWTASHPTSARGTSTTFSRSVVATEAVPGIKTPYGVAEQGSDVGSIALRSQVESGGTVYRQGVTGTQQTAEGQFWAGQNPALTPGYANSYGTPGTQVAQGEYAWIMGGTVEPGTPFVTRGAPGIGTNLGGAPEVVVNPGCVRNLWFHMPD